MSDPASQGSARLILAPTSLLYIDGCLPAQKEESLWSLLAWRLDPGRNLLRAWPSGGFPQGQLKIAAFTLQALVETMRKIAKQISKSM